MPPRSRSGSDASYTGERAITINFATRADLRTNPELMDQPASFEDLRDCLRDISRVNRLSLAYRPTLDWLDSVSRAAGGRDLPLHIVDVGCGYGDMLREIAAWAHFRQIPVRLTGIDLNPQAIRAAREATPTDGVTFLEGDAFAFSPPGGIDIVVSSLLTHHLENEQIVAFLIWMEEVARLGWFVNDLHRQPVPYFFFRLFRRFARWHRFVKHDGAVSILRSFRREDWVALAAAARIPQNEYSLREFRPARLCVARQR